MTASTPGPRAAAKPSHQLDAPPESAQLTAATIRAWRTAGWRVSEQHVANWLYLVVRSNQESAVYKVIGLVFRGQEAGYKGVRVA
jgi:hypothetical protein